MRWLKNRKTRHEVMARAIAQSLALQLIMLRTARGMTQKEFAEFLGMSQSRISLLETEEGM